MLEAANVSKSYGDLTAVREVSFSVAPGRILGLIGPNGAGKTTTIRMLGGLVRPSSGRVRIDGFDMAESPLDAKRRLGYVPESPELYDFLTATEYLLLVAALHHLAAPTARAAVAQVVDELELGDARHRLLREFSKGNRQKVLLAAALLHEPSTLLLDEPFEGLDPFTAEVFGAVVRSLADRGRVVLLSSHAMEMVEGFATEIAIMAEGTIRARGTPEEICAAAETHTLAQAFRVFAGVGDAEAGAKRILASVLRA